MFGRDDAHSLFVLPLSARICTPGRQWKPERATCVTDALQNNVVLVLTEGQGRDYSSNCDIERILLGDAAKPLSVFGRISPAEYLPCNCIRTSLLSAIIS